MGREGTRGASARKKSPKRGASPIPSVEDGKASTTSNNTDDDAKDPTSSSSTTVPQHPLARATEGMNRRSLLTGLYGSRGERIRHVVASGALLLPEDSLDIMASYEESNEDKSTSKTTSQQQQKGKKRKAIPLPGLDSVVRPSMDKILKKIVVTDVFHKQFVHPTDPTQPPNVRTVAANRYVDLILPDTERIRGGGEGEDEKTETPATLEAATTQSTAAATAPLSAGGAPATIPNPATEGNPAASNPTSDQTQASNAEVPAGKPEPTGVTPPAAPTGVTPQVASTFVTPKVASTGATPQVAPTGVTPQVAPPVPAAVPPEPHTVAEAPTPAPIASTPAPVSSTTPVPAAASAPVPVPGATPATTTATLAAANVAPVPATLTPAAPLAAPAPASAAPPAPPLVPAPAASSSAIAATATPTKGPSSMPPVAPASATKPAEAATDKVIPLVKKPDPHWEQHVPSANDENLTDPEAKSAKPGWYDARTVSNLERTMLPEWFDESASHRSVETYLKARETMIHISKQMGNRYVTSTLARRSLPGDVGSLHRLHSFLTCYLWMNEEGRNDSAPTAPSLQHPAQLVEKEWNEKRRGDLLEAVVEASNAKKPKTDSEGDAMEVDGADQQDFVAIDWGVIADKVGASAGECEREFLAMPLDEASVATTTEPPFSPDTMASDPVRSVSKLSSKDEMAQEEFVRSLVEGSNPKVIRAVTEAALTATSQNLPTAQRAARLGLVASQAASAAQAHEETVSRLLSEVLDQRMQKLECRMALMDDLEGMLEAERVALELERRDLYTTKCRDWFGNS